MKYLILISPLLFLACATSPTGRSQLIAIPAGVVDEMGVGAFDEMKTKIPVSKDAALTSYVRCVANEITAVLPEKKNWEVVVFESGEPNAFALPGEKIGVYTGMMKVAREPAQLAAVLGHEVGHVLSQHSNERLSEAKVIDVGLGLTSAVFKNKDSKTYQIAMAALGAGAQFGVVLPHSRTQESEADIIGLRLMSEAGFDPRGAPQLWRNMEALGGGQPPEFMSTHPSHGTRIQNLEANMGPALAVYQANSKRTQCLRR